ncbi:MAG: hypothetical protein HEP71_26175 [Roseivirga sp.]|nr:hypothetical protein [Roseivirga sp.]
MKKLFFTALLSLMVLGVHAQKKTFKAAKKAFNKKDYTTAIDLAKQCAANAETQDNPEVYKIIGQANMYLFNEDLTQLSLAQASFDNFETAIEKGGDKMKDDLMEDVVLNAENVWLAGGKGLMYLQNMLNRQGNVHFEAQEYDKSYEYFLISSKIIPDDIVMSFYVGYSAYGSDKDKEALENYMRVIELNEALPEEQKFANTQFAYNGLIDIYFARQEDYDNALKYIRMAKEAYPDEKLYKDYEIDVLIKSEKMDEAIQGLKDVAASGNATKTTYYTMAFLYWNSENFDEALKAADLALGLDPEYYDALYVAGSVHYNLAYEKLKAANNTDDDAEYQKLKKEAYAKFREAMPYFEKGIVQRPEDTYFLNPLSTIYDQLDMDDKRDEILDRIAKIEGND